MIQLISAIGTLAEVAGAVTPLANRSLNRQEMDERKKEFRDILTKLDTMSPDETKDALWAFFEKFERI